MSITRGKCHPTHLYTLCGHVLSSVQEAKYFGITLTDELSWSSHVRSIHNRANSSLGFLRRNLRRCPAKLTETAYITLVRSTLKYAAPVWDPHLARDCDLLEKIQRRLARFVKGDHRTTSSVTQMLHDLGWRDLSVRRRDLRLALLYKVVTGHVAVNGFLESQIKTPTPCPFLVSPLKTSPPIAERHVQPEQRSTIVQNFTPIGCTLLAAYYNG